MKQGRESPRARMRKLVGELAQSTSAPDVGKRLAQAGLPGSPDVVKPVEEIVRRLGSQPDSHDQLATFLIDLLESPSPGGALLNFTRYLEISGASGAFLSTVGAGKPIREILAAVFGSSQYMSDIIIRNPGLLYWLIEQATWDAEDSVSSYRSELEADIANFHSLESKLNAVRRSHRKLLLRIGVKDLLGKSTIVHTTAALSHLADAIVQTVLELLWLDASDLASPAPSEGFAVLALGKLGGLELNYSSDIDLIYVCDDVDEELIDAYHKLARRLSTVISEVTPEGYLYRVDLRLRPDGRSGPLINPLTSMRIYYENRGRPWEFQAMLKARVVAGDAAIGDAFLHHISGLIGNPSLSYSPVETIGLMRTRIRANISPREQVFNIKLMEGGIRDIEFIVQTLQLLHGQRFPDIRVGNTKEGMQRARSHDLITELEHEAMLGAYRFFRLVEHRLQMMHQIQTHSIPESEEEIAVLAGRVSQGPLGTFTTETFLDELSTHLNKIRLLSDRFFTGEEVSEPALLLLLPEDHELAARTLGKYGLPESAQSLSIIQSLAYGSFPDLFDRQTRSAFQKLLPKLLDDVAVTGDPGATLVNFSKIAGAIKSKATFYDLLAESGAARRLFRDLTGTSCVLTHKLSRNIEILDSLLEDPRRLLSTRVAQELSWSALSGKPSSDEIDRLRGSLGKAIDSRVLAAWILDTENGTQPDTVERALADATQGAITAAFEALIGDTEGVGLFALGSFAAGEPGLTSDVDLLVVTRERDIADVTRRIHQMHKVFPHGDHHETVR